MPFSLFRGFSGGSGDGAPKSDPASSSLADASLSSPSQSITANAADRRNTIDYYSFDTEALDSFNDAELPPQQKSKRSFSISTDNFRMPKSLLSGFAPAMSVLPEHSSTDVSGDQTMVAAHATTIADTNNNLSLSQSIFSSVFGGGPSRFRRRAMSVDSGVGGSLTSPLDDSKSSELSMLNNNSNFAAASPQSPTMNDDDVFRQEISKSVLGTGGRTVPSTVSTCPGPMEQQVPCDIRQSVPILVSFVQY